MLFTPYEFYAPTTLSDALYLMDHHPGAKPLSGGMSMVPAMNLGLFRPEVVVSLNHVAGLAEINDEGDVLRLGGMVRHHHVATSSLVHRHAPLLAEAAGLIADVQVRHRGTIGGSVSHADPAADYLSVLGALDARITVASMRGERTIAAREFFVDVLSTALEPSELVVSIVVPKIVEGASCAYARLSRVEGSFALVNAAAIVTGARVVAAVGGTTAVPALIDISRDPDTGDSDGLLVRVGDAAFEACADAFGDLNGSAGYRRAMARVFARRAVERALVRRHPEPASYND